MDTTRTARAARTKAAATAALAGIGLLLTACGEGNGEATRSSSKSAPSDATQSDVDGFPVGEAFGEPVWSIDGVAEGDELVVRGDRLIAYTMPRESVPESPEDAAASGKLNAYSPDGDQVWTYSLPEDPNGLDVQVLNETVAVLTGGVADGDGLSTSKAVSRVVLLSIDDGSVVAEADLPLASATASLPARLMGDGVYMTEDGRLHEFPDEYSAPMATQGPMPIVDGTLLWSDNGGHNLVTKNWRDDEHRLADLPPLVDQLRGRVLVVERGTSAPEDQIGSMLDVRTGTVLFDISCPDNPKALSFVGSWAADPNSSHSAVSSPNGQFMVSGPLWISDAEGRCIGGGDGQQKVQLTAVDDSGTAYGLSEEGDLVVVPAGGNPEVSELPKVAVGSDRRAAPFAVMDGGLALHWNGETVTANPIK